MANYTIFQMFENPRRGRQARHFTKHVLKILDLIPLGAPGGRSSSRRSPKMQRFFSLLRKVVAYEIHTRRVFFQEVVPSHRGSTAKLRFLQFQIVDANSSSHALSSVVQPANIEIRSCDGIHLRKVKKILENYKTTTRKSGRCWL